MKALVTGATGFLGAWLVRLLQEGGHSVRALVRPARSLGALEALGVEEVRGDVTEPHSLERAVAGCDWVFHLAGLRRAASREEFMEVNAESTRHLLEACLVAAPGLRRFVLAGSLGASGPSATGKREEDPLQPVEWYGESKAEAERIAFSYAGQIPVAVARPPRIVGPGDRENLIFFKTVQAGFLLDLGGPPRPLSFVDVEDCARGFLLLAESPAAAGQAFFLSSAERTDLASLQRQVARALGVSPRAVPVPGPLLSALAWAADGVSLASGLKLPLNRKLAAQLLAPGWTCDPGKARRVLGFEARISLAESVDRAARWYREHGWM